MNKTPSFTASYAHQYRRDNPECVQTVRECRPAVEISAWDSPHGNPFWERAIEYGESKTRRDLFTGAPDKWSEEQGATHSLVSPVFSVSHLQKELNNPGGIHPFRLLVRAVRLRGNILERMEENDAGEIIWCKVSNWKTISKK